jgi:hypothetical protein
VKVKDKVKGLRLSHLVLSLGWDGAREYLAKLSPEEKKDYFISPKEERNG